MARAGGESVNTRRSVLTNFPDVTIGLFCSRKHVPFPKDGFFHPNQHDEGFLSVYYTRWISSAYLPDRIDKKIVYF